MAVTEMLHHPWNVHLKTSHTICRPSQSAS